MRYLTIEKQLDSDYPLINAKFILLRFNQLFSLNLWQSLYVCVMKIFTLESKFFLSGFSPSGVTSICRCISCGTAVTPYCLHGSQFFDSNRPPVEIPGIHQTFQAVYF